MTNELTIVAHHRPEILERILRVVRHRGFTVIKLKMNLENGKIWLDFVVEGERDICLLAHQLVKLEDIIDITTDEECECDE
ncbi:acetolactate synthase 2 small subunit [Basfia succiniciproducens]|uniref:Acetolactate synthase, small subunit n=1 Tax=Basfia succiniciproducens TaxID=653940 RepID=A0A1G5D6S7_9PAST|nr:acetolactate synthase 2 small subunit [Basfia succiniciproducens]QIM69351.1 acetolactate synthase [Basfia succiniciproducens]SCY10392.1 acetolactate synthase, small subunit [Basfia succiniciproducens]SEQ22946.1 acetolactate synthase, small subunit [Basfia succiniciproducens]